MDLKMNIFIEKENKHIELKKSLTGTQLLKELGYSSSSTLLVRNGEVILPDEQLSENDDVQVLSVVSGG